MYDTQTNKSHEILKKNVDQSLVTLATLLKIQSRNLKDRILRGLICQNLYLNSVGLSTYILTLTTLIEVALFVLLSNTLESAHPLLPGCGLLYFLEKRCFRSAQDIWSGRNLFLLVTRSGRYLENVFSCQWRWTKERIEIRAEHLEESGAKVRWKLKKMKGLG